MQEYHAAWQCLTVASNGTEAEQRQCNLSLGRDHGTWDSIPSPAIWIQVQSFLLKVHPIMNLEEVSQCMEFGCCGCRWQLTGLKR